MADIVLPVPVSVLWASLKDFPYGLYRDRTWAECFALRKRFGYLIGELYLKEDAQTDDFVRVPINCDLRVVMMPQEEGFILRWLNADAPLLR
jgi:hypothetical protein